MTHLTDMKITAAERKERAKQFEKGPVASMDGDVYDYGLRVRLNDDSLEKLGLDSLPKVGKRVRLTAVCSVTSTSENASTMGGKDQKNRSLELQIEKLGVDLEPGSAEEAMDDALDRE